MSARAAARNPDEPGRETPQDAARFASAQEAYLTGAAVLVGGLAALLLAAFGFTLLAFPDSLFRPVLAAAAAALSLAAAGLGTVRAVSAWRRERAGHPGQDRPAWLRWLLADPSADRNAAPDPTLATRLGGRIRGGGQALARRIGAQALKLGAVALVALFVLWSGWSRPPLAMPERTAALIGAASLLLPCFLLLVAERRLAGFAADGWPEAADLSLLLRLPIVVLLGSAGVLGLGFGGVRAALALAVLLGLLPVGVACEFALRSVAALFSPQDASAEPPFLAASAVSRLLHWPPRPFAAVGGELRDRFGIDLRQVWAFGFIRRAAAPVVVAILLVGWLCTGIQQVPLDGRAVYERFGRPVAVLPPGLHSGLPWPMGRAVAVENGVVHELAATAQADTLGNSERGPAEGPPPAGADRLWDTSHDSETAQVIAGGAGDAQNFQIVNMDVRFIYRIGLTDAAAMAATYNVGDPAALIRSSAGRVLVHELATRTLDGVLGERRADLAHEIAARVQADLDRLGSGVEVLAAVIEAIHPPAGAASAYHGVQAAQIDAEALIAAERGKAAEQMSDAHRFAATSADDAQAGGRETASAAQAVLAGFTAEEKAYAAAGRAFLLERYFGALGRGLPGAKVLILDRQIGAGGAPTLDLRSFMLPLDGAAAAAPPPGADPSPKATAP